MRYAVRDGVRVDPQPRTRASCPLCHGHVEAKCGKIVTWHWSHTVRDCDDWAESTTQWHNRWQDTVPRERREVVMKPHRADIVATDGTIVELQHSSINVNTIREREAFYGDMVWIFDARAAFAERRLSFTKRDGFWTFRWKHPRKAIAACTKPVYLDIDGAVFRLKKIHPEAPCGGWGQIGDAKDIIEWMNR